MSQSQIAKYSPLPDFSKKYSQTYFKTPLPRLLSPPVRSKRSRKTPGAPAAPAPPALADVIAIPDDLRGSRKKTPMESKVVKKKVPSAPVESKVVKKKAPSKKNQGPAKAGSTPPLPIHSVVANTTQKTSYTLDKVLGSGGFGYIYVVTCDGDKQRAVMKVVSAIIVGQNKRHLYAVRQYTLYTQPWRQAMYSIQGRLPTLAIDKVDN